MGPIHLLLTVQTMVILLLSVNRLSSWTVDYVAPNEFLRWVDLNNMLPLPLISLVAFYLIKKLLETNHPAPPGLTHHLLDVLFLVGVYLTGAGYGDHEVTNYLHHRFCLPDDGSALCRIVIFNDDEFSHWLFFAGFVLTNASLMLFQVLLPIRNAATWRDGLWLVVNGLFVGLGIFANLAFEEIGVDLYIVAFLAVLAVGLLRRWGRQPLLIYYSTAYLLGLVATAIYKAL
jgi:hypothetical protein